ncbi:MAG: MMPL family transporter, partial [Myxococcales bacterium]|nr:MMPL family transporter [Myxococcales bacterium]
RRLRALLAVMPPLLLGSLWTAALASLMPGGLSAIAVAFMSVVIGVGVDTGVHVYAALLEARQAGVPPDEAAAVARAETQRPVLVAAATAAVAFAALALSDIAALRQLGILCAAGELLTAVAIVIITPEIGAWLERKPPPAPSPARWTGPLVALTRGRGRAAICVILLAAPAVAVAFGYAPRISSAIVALRPKGLAPLEVQERIDKAFGGRPGQWVLMVADTDEASARRRTDRLYEALLAEPEHLDAIDSISTLAPAPDTQRERLAERDALDLPARATALEAALTEVGFAASRFEPVLAAMRAPPHDVFDRGDLKESGYMLERYLGQDAGEVLVVTYLLPKPGFEAEVEATVARVDPAAVLTGYRRLDKTLRESLTTELPRIALLAAALVIGALAFALRRIRDVAIAITVVALEIGMVLALVRALDVPLHIYDALVLPVLLGITVDEAMFLLHRARTVGDDPSFIDMTLRYEGPPVATTALTTAAGFAGLLLCDFDGLRHLGAMGAIGSVDGLVVALVVVPAGLRVARG